MRGRLPSATGVAIYIRVSTGPQEERGTSLQSQEAACRAYAATHGFAVDELHVYREVHTGTELWERPQLTKMREAFRRKQVGSVISHSIDRLARDPTHLGVIVSEAEHYGVAVHFVTEALDDSPEGQLIRFVRGYAAKVEHEKIRERSVRGKLARLQSGKLHNHSTDLYGYVRDKHVGVRLIQVTEAAIVRQVFKWVGEEAVPIRTVVRRLNETGVPAASIGKRQFEDRVPRWGKGAIARMLREPAYYGVTYGWRFKGSSSKQVVRPEADWIRLPDGATPPIVSEELWLAVQRHLDTNTGAATRNAKSPALLRGLIECAVCGCALYPDTEKGHLRVYRCSSRDKTQKACGGRRVPGDEIEDWVWDRVSSVIRDPSVVAAELERRKADDADQGVAQELAEVKAEIRKIEGQRVRLVEALALGDVAVDLIYAELARRDREKQRLAVLLQDVEVRKRGRLQSSQLVANLTQCCQQLAARLDGFGFNEKRLALEALGVRLKANGSGRRGSPIEWRILARLPIGGEGLPDGVLTITCWRCGQNASSGWTLECEN